MLLDFSKKLYKVINKLERKNKHDKEKFQLMCFFWMKIVLRKRQKQHNAIRKKLKPFPTTATHHDGLEM